MGKILCIYMLLTCTAKSTISILQILSKEVCYPKVGCFENKPPWTSLVRPVLPPENPLKIQPFITIYNRQIKHGLDFEIYPEINIKNLNQLDINKDTYVVIHGFTENGKLQWVQELKDVLLDKQDANVFIPDYSKSVKTNYPQSVGNIRVLSKLYAEALKTIRVPFSRLHIIGHSLGAHLGSYICKEFKKSGIKVSWLTALDPAGPLFENFEKIVRLDPSDADFVDAHHTSSGSWGMTLPQGHVDFYYNGGTSQPACKLSITSLFKDLGCDHKMVHQYYISSIRNGCLFGLASGLKPHNLLQLLAVGKQKLTAPYVSTCKTENSCLSVGLGTKNANLGGIFTVFTKDSPPYCSYQARSQVELRDCLLPIVP